MVWTYLLKNARLHGDSSDIKFSLVHAQIESHSNKQQLYNVKFECTGHIWWYFITSNDNHSIKLIALKNSHGCRGDFDTFMKHWVKKYGDRGVNRNEMKATLLSCMLAPSTFSTTCGFCTGHCWPAVVHKSIAGHMFSHLLYYSSKQLLLTQLVSYPPLPSTHTWLSTRFCSMSPPLA